MHIYCQSMHAHFGDRCIVHELGQPYNVDVMPLVGMLVDIHISKSCTSFATLTIQHVHDISVDIYIYCSLKPVSCLNCH